MDDAIACLTFEYLRTQPPFVAPEILKNIPHDQKSDMWSIGVVVYILLVGYPPFMKDTQAELFKQIRTATWDFIEEDWEHVSQEAQDLIKNLLVVDPDQRWTAEEALRCAWIQDPQADATSRDLMSSIQTLRQRRSRLRQFGNPVVWENDATESTPVDVDIKIQEPVQE
jgi:serine/threonine protein kinase